MSAPMPRLLVVFVLIAFPVALMVLARCAVSSDPVDFEFKDEKFAFETPPSPLPTIDPNLPLASLLPKAPAENQKPVYLGDDLACVPELMLEAAPTQAL